jgi:hypothetical protein
MMSLISSQRVPLVNYKSCISKANCINTFFKTGVEFATKNIQIVRLVFTDKYMMFMFFIIIREIMSSRHKFGIQVDRNVIEQLLERKVESE